MDHLYADDDVPPDDFAILSLREPKVYRLSELGCQPAAAQFTAADIEQRIGKILDESCRLRRAEGLSFRRPSRR